MRTLKFPRPPRVNLPPPSVEFHHVALPPTFQALHVTAFHNFPTGSFQSIHKTIVGRELHFFFFFRAHRFYEVRIESLWWPIIRGLTNGKRGLG